MIGFTERMESLAKEVKEMERDELEALYTSEIMIQERKRRTLVERVELLYMSVGREIIELKGMDDYNQLERCIRDGIAGLDVCAQHLRLILKQKRLIVEGTQKKDKRKEE